MCGEDFPPFLGGYCLKTRRQYKSALLKWPLLGVCWYWVIFRKVLALLYCFVSSQVARLFQESLNGCGGGRGFQWVLLEQLEAVASRQRDSSRGCGLRRGRTSGLDQRTFLLEKQEKVSEVFMRIVLHWNCLTRRVKMKEEQHTAITINYLL